MRWRSARRSSNVQDRRGGGGGRIGSGLGLGGIAIVLVVGLMMGADPGQMLSMLTQGGGVAPSAGPGIADEHREFVAAILGETEDVWRGEFAERNAEYPPPTLVLFSGAVQSGCGSASAAVGPFYCPLDRQIYLDLGFFADMERLGGSSGEFAQAYVIAHEVGHHVQRITGVLDRVQQARQRGQNVEGATGLAVRQELQADCYAGVWAHAAQKRHNWLEQGDLEQALQTASAIGDDRLQKRSQGTVVPDAFTHGSAEQRVRWFRIGFEHGEPARCDTFAAAAL
jgi:uncharacterized protein